MGAKMGPWRRRIITASPNRLCWLELNAAYVETAKRLEELREEIARREQILRGLAEHHEEVYVR